MGKRLKVLNQGLPLVVQGIMEDLSQVQLLMRQRYREKMQEEPYSPIGLFIVMRYDCVFSCDHCFFYSSPKTKLVLPNEVIYRAVDFAADNGLRAVMLTGGEPMLAPPKVFDALRYIKGKNLDAILQSSFLGNTRDEIEINAEALGQVGIDILITSLSMFHERSIPPSMVENYLDNLVMIVDAVTRRGIPVNMKNSWDVILGETSTEHAEQFAKKLLKAGAGYVGQTVLNGRYLFEMNGQRIEIMCPSIISVGNARHNGLISQKSYKWEQNLYKCPIFNEVHHDGGMLTVYPDGNVARCCSAERGANFGFGNALIDSFRTIMDNIGSSTYVRPDMERVLREGHQMLREEFPNLLPSEDAAQPCEICSPIVARERTRKRLSQRLNEPNLFVPYHQKK